MSQSEALARLREILEPGDMVHTIRRHTSRSGVSCSVSLFAAFHDELQCLDHLAAPALGLSLDRKHGGVRCSCASTNTAADSAALVNQLGEALGYQLRHRQL